MSAALQALRGAGWVLADGRSVTGSAYATITGTTAIPDMRGLFLRGKNNGRTDGNKNPDGDLGLGAIQGDQIVSHVHSTHLNCAAANWPNSGTSNCITSIYSYNGTNQYFNDSTGEGELGQDARGPWNEGNGWQFEEAPAFAALRNGK